MNRLLVPLDGSRLAEAALPMAQALARDYGAEVLLLRAVSTEGPPEVQTEGKQEADAYLTGVGADLRAQGLPAVRWSVWFGEPEQTIINAAVRDETSLIVMSTHGRRGLDRVLFGSVAESLVRKAPAPVLLVRGQLPTRPDGAGRILVALDGSELSASVLPVVGRMAGPLDLTIELLHAVEPFQPTALPAIRPHLEQILRQRRADAERYLAETAQALEERGLRVHHTVHLGSPVEVILQQGQDKDVGLIAMSTHGRTGLGRLLVGSVAERVLRAAPAPLLLWKVPEWPEAAPSDVRGPI